MRTFIISPTGPFSLAEAGTFGFGQRLAPRWDGVLRLAFCLDGAWTPVGVEVRQDSAGVRCVAHGDGDGAAVRAQVARVLSLDHDGAAFVAVGDRDPVIARLLAAAPGLRPPLFYSPYEAAAWSVLSARRPAAQMAEVRQRLSERYGTVFDLAGERVAALPPPAALVELSDFPGLPPEKVVRLRGVARAALDGQLDVERLHRLGPEAALADVQRIRGIGPFYAGLVVVRGSGFADVLPGGEPKLLGLAGRLYGLGGPATPDQLAEIAEPWRPYRTWAAVLVRAVGPRILDGDTVAAS